MPMRRRYCSSAQADAEKRMHALRKANGYVLLRAARCGAPPSARVMRDGDDGAHAARHELRCADIAVSFSRLPPFFAMPAIFTPTFAAIMMMPCRCCRYLRRR